MWESHGSKRLQRGKGEAQICVQGPSPHSSKNRLNPIWKWPMFIGNSSIGDPTPLNLIKHSQTQGYSDLNNISDGPWTLAG